MMEIMLLSPLRFLEDFKARILTAKNRVWLQAMVIETGEVMDQVEPLLIDAVRRGVDVRLYYDWVTQVYFHGEIRLLPSFNGRQKRIEREFHAKNSVFYTRLRQAGVQVVEMNRPPLGAHVLPVMGRNHIKIYIVDDVCWMGGMNFFDENFAVHDFLVRFDAPQMVGVLSKQILMVNQNKPIADCSWEVGELGTLVVDSGKRGSSLIYENVLEIARKAQKTIVFASQLVPENLMLELLLEKAQAGVQITIYTSNLEDKNFTIYPFKYFYRKFRQKITLGRGSITFIHLDKKIHAKVVLVDEREVMFGSHNFVESGVRMGTQEISLRTVHPDLVAQVKGFVDSLQENLEKV